ncbi:MAG TPA: DNRLRE domain-containing protein [Thermoplasmata archaeon]|jgi:hypothetical protein|nr:DNRLRE domain-containing protein [Thermoplasmata archaeon]
MKNGITQKSRRILRCCAAIAVVSLFIGTSVAIESNVNIENTTKLMNHSRGMYSLNPTDDAHIRQNFPDNNEGSGPDMNVRNDGGVSGAWQALVRFDLSSIPGDAIIISATLKCYYRANADNDPSGRPLYVYKILDDWKEESVTWYTRPSFSTISSAVSPVPDAPGQWISWDVKSDVVAFLNNTVQNYGWKISDDTYWSDPYIPIIRLTTKESSFIPVLEILVNDPPVAPQITGQTNGGVGNSYDYTFIGSDPDGDQLYYTIEWGDGQTNTWVGPYPSSQPLTLPHSWSEKGTYNVRAKVKDTHDAESDWATLEVTMPYSYNIPFQPFWQRFFELFPNALPMFRHILGY